MCFIIVVKPFFEFDNLKTVNHDQEVVVGIYWDKNNFETFNNSYIAVWIKLDFELKKTSKGTRNSKQLTHIGFNCKKSDYKSVLYRNVVFRGGEEISNWEGVSEESFLPGSGKDQVRVELCDKRTSMQKAMDIFR